MGWEGGLAVGSLFSSGDGRAGGFLFVGVEGVEEGEEEGVEREGGGVVSGPVRELFVEFEVGRVGVRSWWRGIGHVGVHGGRLGETMSFCEAAASVVSFVERRRRRAPLLKLE